MSKKKYINADVLSCFYKQVDELQHSPDKISKIKARFLKNNVIPTIQNYKIENAEEVRYGEWERRIVEKNGVAEMKSVCSECGKTNKRYEPPYCPHCGAKMKGSDNNGQ